MKRAFLLIGALLCFAGEASASVGYVQHKECPFTGGVTLTQPCSFGSTPAAGDGVAITVLATVAPSGVTDGNATSYTNTAWASGATTCDANAILPRAYSLPNSTGLAGTGAITVTFGSAPGYGTINMIEMSGVASSSFVDKLDCANNSTGTTPASPSVTTTGADFLFSTAIDTNLNSRTWTAGATPAYTLVSTATGVFQASQYFLQSAGAAVTGNFTINTSDNVTATIFAVKPAAAGASPVPRRR
jgi:hypothetical protein